MLNQLGWNLNTNPTNKTNVLGTKSYNHRATTTGRKPEGQHVLVSYMSLMPLQDLLIWQHVCVLFEERKK